MKDMSLFSPEEENTILQKYQEDLMKAGSDYTAVSQVQAKYATFFNNKAEQIVRLNPRVESEDSKISGRIYFNDNNKNLLIGGYAGGQNTANLKHMPKGLCVVCGKSFSGLGIHDVYSSVSICVDCTDENNYVDFKEFVLCDFGG